MLVCGFGVEKTCLLEAQRLYLIWFNGKGFSFFDYYCCFCSTTFNSLVYLGILPCTYVNSQWFLIADIWFCVCVSVCVECVYICILSGIVFFIVILPIFTLSLFLSFFSLHFIRAHLIEQSWFRRFHVSVVDFFNDSWLRGVISVDVQYNVTCRYCFIFCSLLFYL